MRKNLELLREQGFRAIDQGAKERCREIFERHTDFLKEYLSERSRLGIKTSEQTAALSAPLGRRPGALDVILNSLVELISAAFRPDRLAITAIAVSSSTSAQIIALNEDDLDVFKRIMQLRQRCLLLALRLGDSAQRNKLLKYAWEGEETVAQYLEWHYLQGGLRDEKSLLGYADTEIQNAETVLKHALDRSLTDEFMLLFDGMIRMYSSQALGGDAQFYRRISEYKQAVAFGLGGWASKLYGDGKIALERYRPIFATVVSFLGDIGGVTRLYLKIKSSGLEGTLPWEIWEIEERPPGEAAALAPTPPWLTLFYLLYCISTIGDAQITDPNTLATLELRALDSATIQLAIQEIREAGERVTAQGSKWYPLFPGLLKVGGGTEQESVEHRVGVIIAFWEDLLSRKRTDEDELLVQAPLAPEALASFRAELSGAWLEKALLRKLACEFDFYEDRTDEEAPAETPNFGLNLLESKQWFQSDNPWGLKSVAENLGTNLANSETAEVFGIMVEGTPRMVARSLDEGLGALDIFLDPLPPDRLRDYVILSTTGHELLVQLLSSPHFSTPRSQEDRKGLGRALQGFYRRVPLLGLWVGRRRSPTLFCANMRRFGKWVQFQAGSPGEALSVSVEVIDEDKARDLLSNNPNVKATAERGALGTTEALRELRKKVHVQAWERFQFSILDAKSAIRIDLAEPAAARSQRQ